MIRKYGQIESAPSADAKGIARLRDGTPVQFSRAVCDGAFAIGAGVCVEFERHQDGSTQALRIRTFPSLDETRFDSPNAILNEDDASLVLEDLEDQVRERGATEELQGRFALYRRVLSRSFVILGRDTFVKRATAAIKQHWPPTRASVPPGEPCSDTVRADLAVLSPDIRPAWDALLGWCLGADGAKPSAKWQKEALQRLTAVGAPALIDALARWLPLIQKPKATNEGVFGFAPPIGEELSTLVKGLVWTASQLDDPRVASLVGDLGVVCFTKVTGVGPVSARIGNACLWSLGAMEGKDGVAQLGRLKARVRYSEALRLIDKALTEAATRRGVSPAELEELSTPTFGLDANGRSQETFGKWTALVAVEGDAASLAWTDGGKGQASIPAEVRAGHPVELKELRARMKEIGTSLTSLSGRLEGLWLAERVLSVKDWRERYIEHGLVGRVARRLIWTFGSGTSARSGIVHQAAIVDRAGAALSLDDREEVRLWHPIVRPASEVLEWRRALERFEITQPFKQAHREIYVLTDAERATDTYSNRFAAHILRQHQFAALCRDRGWQYHLMGQWDSANTPAKAVPGTDMRIEFWVESAWNDENVSPAGIYLHVTTDQVRFVRDGGAVPLMDVPVLAFSEMMRDVDLFVGVCSIGNDPTWETGTHGQGRTYWEAYAFGELSATAATRRDSLAALLPRLKIGPKCRLDGRFLIVQGTLRTYKIHLGSGNIMMEPNGQYLCIVPDRAPRSRDEVRLPYEGDTLLSIILSKALMLAADDKIKDPSILSQIRR